MRNAGPASLTLLPTEAYPAWVELRDLAFLLGQDAAGLAGRLAPAAAGATGDLVRGMNCYYSNLIEGHDTRPIDIERALHADFAAEPKRGDLQREAAAHIRIETTSAKEVRWGMSRKEDDAASRPDADNPEWTREQMRKARPALELIAEKFGADTAQALRRRRPPAQAEPQGQPGAATRSRRAGSDRRVGPGWQTLMNGVLRRHMPREGK